MELGGSFQKLNDGVCRFDGILDDGYSTGRGSVCTESSVRVRKVGDQRNGTGSRDAGRGGDSLFSIEVCAVLHNGDGECEYKQPQRDTLVAVRMSGSIANVDRRNRRSRDGARKDGQEGSKFGQLDEEQDEPRGGGLGSALKWIKEGQP